MPLPLHQPGQPFQAFWPRQIQWLRRYSNYLTPHKGALTGDTWSAVASWIRNVSVNQGLLISIFLAVLCVPHLFAPHVHLRPYRANGAKSSSVVSSVTNGGARTMLTLDLGPAQPPQVVDELAAAPTQSFAHIFQRYARWDILDYALTRPLEHSGFPFLPARQRERRQASAFGILRVFALERRRSARPARKQLAGQVSPLADFLGECPDRRAHAALRPLHDPRVPQSSRHAPFTLQLFCLLAGLVWTETFSGGAISRNSSPGTRAP